MDQREFLLEVLCGDVAAVEFVERFAGLCQVWDDLVDRDKPVTPEQVSETFIDALVHIPRNPFYQRHLPELQPIIEQLILDWLTANELERGDRHELTLAFVLRERLASLVVRCASLLGGFEWGAAVGRRIWLRNHDGHLDEYLREHQGEFGRTEKA